MNSEVTADEIHSHFTHQAGQGRRALAGANPWRIFSKVVSKKLILDIKEMISFIILEILTYLKMFLHI
jgi:hypothetical protein